MLSPRTPNVICVGVVLAGSVPRSTLTVAVVPREVTALIGSSSTLSVALIVIVTEAVIPVLTAAAASLIVIYAK